MPHESHNNAGTKSLTSLAGGVCCGALPMIHCFQLQAIWSMMALYACSYLVNSKIAASAADYCTRHAATSVRDVCVVISYLQPQSSNYRGVTPSRPPRMHHSCLDSSQASDSHSAPQPPCAQPQSHMTRMQAKQHKLGCTGTANAC